MLLVGVGLAWAMSIFRGDVAYVLVIIWAFAGIAVKNSGTPVVATAAWVAAGLAVLGLVMGLILTRQRQRKAAAPPEAAI